jgi:4-hydroxy 2-oxovalerate aldolase
MQAERKVDLLDVTIRDGGYANSYGFSLADITHLVGNVENSGISMIEIGHGFGISAEDSISKMAHKEVEYLIAAVRTVKQAKIGMFGFPNIAKTERLTELAEVGLGFLRVGFFGINDGPHSLEDALPLVERARRLGVYTSANIVRTQMYTLHEIDEILRRVRAVGVDSVAVVDSPGGALPSQIFRYVKHIKDRFDGPVGFHGHQNLTLGVANSLAAAEAGATVIDGTLGGIGRDSGNTQLEVIAIVLEKAGFRTFVDVEMLCENAAPRVASIATKGISADNLRLGRYDLMSHELPLIRTLAASNNVDWHAVAGEFRAKRVNFGAEDNVLALIRGLGYRQPESVSA